MNAIDEIMRDICELEPDNPDDENVICINAEALRVIIERHFPVVEFKQGLSLERPIPWKRPRGCRYP